MPRIYNELKLVSTQALHEAREILLGACFPNSATKASTQRLFGNDKLNDVAKKLEVPLVALATGAYVDTGNGNGTLKKSPILLLTGDKPVLVSMEFAAKIKEQLRQTLGPLGLELYEGNAVFKISNRDGFPVAELTTFGPGSERFGVNFFGSPKWVNLALAIGVSGDLAFDAVQANRLTNKLSGAVLSEFESIKDFIKTIKAESEKTICDIKSAQTKFDTELRVEYTNTLAPIAKKLALPEFDINEFDQVITSMLKIAFDAKYAHETIKSATITRIVNDISGVFEKRQIFPRFAVTTFKGAPSINVCIGFDQANIEKLIGLGDKAFGDMHQELTALNKDF